VAGKRVLDAACGPGLYAAELVRCGAQVVGFDQSPRMVEICRGRVSQGEFRVHDLADRIDWLPDGSVDLALCALALEYVDDRISALSELRRVLKPDGALVLSRMHPTGAPRIQDPLARHIPQQSQARWPVVVSVVEPVPRVVQELVRE
jgi:ubiquinone/menaquinone biosynthesis C-methylase UbiE